MDVNSGGSPISFGRYLLLCCQADRLDGIIECVLEVSCELAKSVLHRQDPVSSISLIANLLEVEPCSKRIFQIAIDEISKGNVKLAFQQFAKLCNMSIVSESLKRDLVKESLLEPKTPTTLPKT